MSFNINQLLNFAENLVNSTIDEREKYKILKTLFTVNISIEQLQKSRLGKSVKKCTKLEGKMAMVAKELIKRWELMIDRHYEKDHSSNFKHSQKSKTSDQGLNGNYKSDKKHSTNHIDPFDSIFKTSYKKPEKTSGKRKLTTYDYNVPHKKQRDANSDFVINDEMVIDKDRSKRVESTKKNEIMKITSGQSLNKCKKVLQTPGDVEYFQDSDNYINSYESVLKSSSSIKTEKDISIILNNDSKLEKRVDLKFIPNELLELPTISNDQFNVNNRSDVIVSLCEDEVQNSSNYNAVNNSQSTSKYRSYKVVQRDREVESFQDSNDHINSNEWVFNNTSSIKTEKDISMVFNNERKLEKGVDGRFITNELTELPTISKDEFNINNRSDVIESLKEDEGQDGSIYNEINYGQSLTKYKTKMVLKITKDIEPFQGSNNYINSCKSVLNSSTSIKAQKDISSNYSSECKLVKNLELGFIPNELPKLPTFSNEEFNVNNRADVMESLRKVKGQEYSNCEDLKNNKSYFSCDLISGQSQKMVNSLIEDDSSQNNSNSLQNSNSPIKTKKYKSSIYSKAEKSSDLGFITNELSELSTLNKDPFNVKNRSEVMETLRKDHTHKCSNYNDTQVQSTSKYKVCKVVQRQREDRTFQNKNNFDSLQNNSSPIKDKKHKSPIYNTECKVEKSFDLGFIPNELPELPTLSKDQYNVNNRSDVMDSLRKVKGQEGSHYKEISNDIDVTCKYSSDMKVWVPKSKSAYKNDAEDVAENCDSINGILVSDLENYNCKQLLAFEGNNRKIMRKTEQFWEKLFRKNYKSVSRLVDENWRNAYIRVENEADEKLRIISERLNRKTESIRESESKIKVIQTPFKTAGRPYKGYRR